jgi:hypothetical protein
MEPVVWGCNWATLSLGDGRKADDLALQKKYFIYRVFRVQADLTFILPSELHAKELRPRHHVPRSRISVHNEHRVYLYIRRSNNYMTNLAELSEEGYGL